MIYIFVFIGEFGYELLNWQGVVRKFNSHKKSNDRIVICSRTGLKSIYEYCDLYIDISNLFLFKNSVADMYMAHNPRINLYRHHKEVIEGGMNPQVTSMKERVYRYLMRVQIKRYTDYYLLKKGMRGKKKYVFSSIYEEIDGLRFGAYVSEGIYADLDINNNEFVQITPTKQGYTTVKEKGFNIDEPYVLCQMGKRAVVNRVSKKPNEEIIISKLLKNNRVVLLDFDTGRKLDSGSLFDSINGCEKYECNSFEEQAVLIYHAKACVFFTEGDFRSHNYLPPLMGKNVYSIANKDVFFLKSAPIDYWNENVFRFGGKIIPIYSEDIVNDSEGVVSSLNEVLCEL